MMPPHPATPGAALSAALALAAQDRKADRAEAIRLACHYLANIAEPTVSGATLILPDGCMLYLSAEDARALHGDAETGSRA
jgi:hypothetical protein